MEEHFQKTDNQEKNDLASIIGDIGKWQLLTLIAVGICGIPNNWQVLAGAFMVPSTKFWCKPLTKPGVFFDVEAWENFSSPLLEKSGSLQRDKCHVIDINYDNVTSVTYDNIESKEIVKPTRKCQEWIFDQSLYESTAISQFNMVCQNDYIKKLFFSVFLSGVLVGAFISGILSDRFGRRNMLLYFSGIQIILGLFQGFVPNVILCLVIRGCLGFLHAAVFNTSYVYCIELVGGKWVAIVGIAYEFVWATSYVTMPAIAYFLPHWIHLQIAITVPIVAFLILFIFVMPESPRWLMANGKNDDALVIINKILKTNGNSEGENCLAAQMKIRSKNEINKPGSVNFFGVILKLANMSNIRRRTLFQCLIWYTNAIVYYIFVTRTAPLLPTGSLFTDFAIDGFLEFLAYFFTMFVVVYLGRRFSLAVTMATSGTGLFLTLGLSSYEILIAVVMNIVKFSTTCAFAINYLHTAEMFPTVVRTYGVGLCSMFARIGAISSVYVKNELKYTYIR